MYERMSWKACFGWVMMMTFSALYLKPRKFCCTSRVGWPRYCTRSRMLTLVAMACRMTDLSETDVVLFSQCLVTRHRRTVYSSSGYPDLRASRIRTLNRHVSPILQAICLLLQIKEKYPILRASRFKSTRNRSYRHFSPIPQAGIH